MIETKDLARVEKALDSTRERILQCVNNGQPATISIEIILKAGGKVAACVVGVRENIKIEG